jgi:predicted DCC family thiol-disulfide oxidoreductase YuxK
MISLHSEITDSRGRQASRGWVCFDRDCNVCTSLARRFQRTLETRGFGLAALQDPRVQALLGLPAAELLREMRVITTEGNVYGGASAIIYLASQIWWARPLYAATRLPAVSRLLDAGYRWFADHRTCSSGRCSVPRKTGEENTKVNALGASEEVRPR